MIQLDQNILKECIREAIKEEFQLIIADLRKTTSTSEQQASQKLLTKKEMADELDISLVSLTDWMKQGRVPYMRLGKRIYFKKQEVINSMANFHHRKSR
ncbi:helix-turn-helix domain-containing protein [Sphingobacterium composti Ten et al. 2007 non Yoo et al. 2007]|uniref:helix-turn-helix domain-containing protein n=1 Tax=Sphingobacterium composti TaxID=363260 RepID=UPI0013598947|nr:helix-turn-helix domain-containing protein [Sphingobacterium composti Ten et al. 2007 non Yoo et al. 2007]